jgi:hypothetical protein
MAIRAWGRLIAQVMDDPRVVSDSMESPTPLQSASSITEIQQTIAKNERNEAFFKLANQWLLSNVEAVCKAQSHSHYKVRMELVASAKLLLIKCSRCTKNYSFRRKFTSVLNVLF